MRVVSGIKPRLQQIVQTTRLSSRLRDKPALAVLGLAQYRKLTSPDLLSRVCRRLFPTLAVRTDRTGHLAVVLNPSDESHLLIFDEVLVENLYDLSAVRFEPDVIVDCGGHIGLFTARAVGRFPRARSVTFEPMPDNAGMIAEMMRQNGMKTQLRREAVSDRDTTAVFYQRVSFGGSLSLNYGGVEKTFDVKVTNLIQVIRELAPRSLLLKMDIEGEEETLLPKLIPDLPAHCAVYFETHTGDQGWDKIHDAFTLAGFEVTLIKNRDPFRDGLAVRGNEPASQNLKRGGVT